MLETKGCLMLIELYAVLLLCPDQMLWGDLYQEGI